MERDAKKAAKPKRKIWAELNTQTAEFKEAVGAALKEVQQQARAAGPVRYEYKVMKFGRVVDSKRPLNRLAKTAGRLRVTLDKRA